MIGTVATRVVITLANLVLVALAGRMLGAEGLGSIGLLVLGVTFMLLLAQLIGGGGLVYVVPRSGTSAVLLPAYVWAIVSGIVGLAVFKLLPLAPAGYAVHVVGLAFLQALNSIHLNILIARQRIGLQNALLVSQSLVQVIGLAILFRADGATLIDYVQATYIAHGLTVLLSGYHALRGSLLSDTISMQTGFMALLRQGGIGQVANLFQLMNYRAAYYLIEAFRGTAALGVYSVAMQLAEGSWLVPKSIGGVLYSKVSNLEEERRQVQLTVIMFKVAVVFGSLCTVVLILLPDLLYSAIFGPEVRGFRPILLLIGPGLVAMSGSQVLSHYLSGTGRITYNLIGSGLGTVATLTVGLALVPVLGVHGAAITATVAYSTSLIYQLIIFIRLTGLKMNELLPHAGDLRKARSLWYIQKSKRADTGSYI
ncbi:MAG: polysaccharide biosynthesis C-terminal domain-containing protein [Flavobacteriales bacterium]